MNTGYGYVRVATGPSGEQRLLVPVGQPSAKMFTLANGNLRVARTTFWVSGKLEHFVDITLRNMQLESVFTDLVQEALRRIENGYGPEAAVQGAIQDFRSLLLPEKAQDIPITTIVGLIGELIVLEKLVARAPASVHAWMGPTSQRHDFRHELISIEVKTSGRSDATRVQVNGPEQLLPPAGGQLYLAHVRLERSEKGGHSVAALCKAILAHGADQIVLSERLARLECHDPEADEWNHASFALEGLDLYRVGPTFPRITPDSFPDGMLPAGVAALSYEVDLSVARKSLLSAEEKERLLLDFVT